jgi:hypothetical protein
MHSEHDGHFSSHYTGAFSILLLDYLKRGGFQADMFETYLLFPYPAIIATIALPNANHVKVSSDGEMEKTPSG